MTRSSFAAAPSSKPEDRGERTGILDLTRGEMGSQGSAETRAEEAERASEILGLAGRWNAGLPDSHLQNTPETRRVVARYLRELRPRVVITHWLQGRHPDHRAAAELVYDASFLAGLKNFAAPGTPSGPSRSCTPFPSGRKREKPTFVVDITEQMERKLEAIAAYGSQFRLSHPGRRGIPRGR